MAKKTIMISSPDKESPHIITCDFQKHADAALTLASLARPPEVEFLKSYAAELLSMHYTPENDDNKGVVERGAKIGRERLCVVYAIRQLEVWLAASRRGQFLSEKKLAALHSISKLPRHREPAPVKCLRVPLTCRNLAEMALVKLAAAAAKAETVDFIRDAVLSVTDGKADFTVPPYERPAGDISYVQLQVRWSPAEWDSVTSKANELYQHLGKKPKSGAFIRDVALSRARDILDS